MLPITSTLDKCLTQIVHAQYTFGIWKFSDTLRDTLHYLYDPLDVIFGNSQPPLLALPSQLLKRELPRFEFCLNEKPAEQTAFVVFCCTIASTSTYIFFVYDFLWRHHFSSSTPLLETYRMLRHPFFFSDYHPRRHPERILRATCH